MLSVMTPVKVLGGAAASAAVTRKLETRNFIRRLLAWDHEVRGAGARAHKPDVGLGGLVAEAERLSGRARDSDGGVAAQMILVGALRVVPHRAKHGLLSRAVLFGGVEPRLVTCKLHVLGYALQVALIGALHRERRSLSL